MGRAAPTQSAWALVAALASPAAARMATWTVEANFAQVVRVSRTVTTLQVVSNPILDRTFVAPNGTRFANPIHEAAWASLAALEADLVRYVPWFPYPKKSVAELDAPVVGKNTSWDFTYILPMLEDFMQATYARNHSTVLNFATQPCWLFGDKDNNTQDCSYPANPDQSDFQYVRGNRANLLDPTARDLAAHYGRLLSYIVKGEFTDEHGVKQSGGPAYSRYTRAYGHVWELFNEAEHAYTVEQYIHDYDVVVAEMIRAVGGQESAPAFMGIGGATKAWVPPFLNASNHAASPPPVDYISLHFYAHCSNRTDPETYSEGFFGGARGFVAGLEQVIADRDASSFPEAKIALNELGVIMPDDNNARFGLDASLPDIYWNAAGAMYAFLFASLAPMGVEVLGHSQLAGSPKIPEWGIPLPQYPSVSLLDWRTGLGNARYWVLKLLIEEFGMGDKLVQVALRQTGATGGGERARGDEQSLSALAATRPDGLRKVLLVNHLNEVQTLTLEGLSEGELALRIVDPKSVQVASASGIRRAAAHAAKAFSLEPFAVVVASPAADALPTTVSPANDALLSVVV